MTIGNRIKELRQELSLSQEKLGALIGVSQKAVAFWENNVCEPKAFYIVKLVRALDMSFDEFFEDVD